MADDEPRDPQLDEMELEYFRTRMGELQREVAERALMLGPLTETELLRSVLGTLRRTGKDDVATRYAHAFEQYQARLQAIEPLGSANAEAAFTALGDAQEDFERVSAEASACFATLDEGKDGAR